MKAQIEIKLNLPDANKMLFDVKITRDKYKKYFAEVFIESNTPGNGGGYIEGKGDIIDEAINDLLKNMPFYNKPKI